MISYGQYHLTLQPLIRSDFCVKEPIYFNRLIIQKRQECCTERYFDICLVLNSSADDPLCTGRDYLSYEFMSGPDSLGQQAVTLFIILN